MKQHVYAAFFAGLLVTVPLITVVLPTFFQQVVYRSTQPSSVFYHSDDPYLLTINERGVDWTTLPPSRRYQLFIGKASDSGHTYGYRLDYSFHRRSTDMQTPAGQVHVAWSASGVSLIEGSGQRVFIPQGLFTRGR